MLIKIAAILNVTNAKLCKIRKWKGNELTYKNLHRQQSNDKNDYLFYIYFNEFIINH